MSDEPTTPTGDEAGDEAGDGTTSEDARPSVYTYRSADGVVHEVDVASIEALADAITEGHESSGQAAEAAFSSTDGAEHVEVEIDPDELP